MFSRQEHALWSDRIAAEGGCVARTISRAVTVRRRVSVRRQPEMAIPRMDLDLARAVGGGRTAILAGGTCVLAEQTAGLCDGVHPSSVAACPARHGRRCGEQGFPARGGGHGGGAGQCRARYLGGGQPRKARKTRKRRSGVGADVRRRFWQRTPHAGGSGGPRRPDAGTGMDALPPAGSRTPRSAAASRSFSNTSRKLGAFHQIVFVTGFCSS